MSGLSYLFTSSFTNDEWRELKRKSVDELLGSIESNCARGEDARVIEVLDCFPNRLAPRAARIIRSVVEAKRWALFDRILSGRHGTLNAQVKANFQSGNQNTEINDDAYAALCAIVRSGNVAAFDHLCQCWGQGFRDFIALSDFISDVEGFDEGHSASFICRVAQWAEYPEVLSARAIEYACRHGDYGFLNDVNFEKIGGRYISLSPDEFEVFLRDALVKNEIQAIKKVVAKISYDVLKHVLTPQTLSELLDIPGSEALHDVMCTLMKGSGKIFDSVIEAILIAPSLVGRFRETAALIELVEEGPRATDEYYNARVLKLAALLEMGPDSDHVRKLFTGVQKVEDVEAIFMLIDAGKVVFALEWLEAVPKMRTAMRSPKTYIRIHTSVPLSADVSRMIELCFAKALADIAPLQTGVCLLRENASDEAKAEWIIEQETSVLDLDSDSGLDMRDYYIELAREMMSRSGALMKRLVQKMPCGAFIEGIYADEAFPLDEVQVFKDNVPRVMPSVQFLDDFDKHRADSLVSQVIIKLLCRRVAELPELPSELTEEHYETLALFVFLHITCQISSQYIDFSSLPVEVEAILKRDYMPHFWRLAPLDVESSAFIYALELLGMPPAFWKRSVQMMFGELALTPQDFAADPHVFDACFKGLCARSKAAWKPENQDDDLVGDMSRALLKILGYEKAKPLIGPGTNISYFKAHRASILRVAARLKHVPLLLDYVDQGFESELSELEVSFSSSDLTLLQCFQLQCMSQVFQTGLDKARALDLQSVEHVSTEMHASNFRIALYFLLASDTAEQHVEQAVSLVQCLQKRLFDDDTLPLSHKILKMAFEKGLHPVVRAILPHAKDPSAVIREALEGEGQAEAVRRLLLSSVFEENPLMAIPSIAEVVEADCETQQCRDVSDAYALYRAYHYGDPCSSEGMTPELTSDLIEFFSLSPEEALRKMLKEGEYEVFKALWNGRLLDDAQKETLAEEILCDRCPELECDADLKPFIEDWCEGLLDDSLCYARGSLLKLLPSRSPNVDALAEAALRFMPEPYSLAISDTEELILSSKYRLCVQLLLRCQLEINLEAFERFVVRLGWADEILPALQQVMERYVHHLSSTEVGEELKKRPAHFSMLMLMVVKHGFKFPCILQVPLFDEVINHFYRVYMPSFNFPYGKCPKEGERFIRALFPSPVGDMLLNESTHDGAFGVLLLHPDYQKWRRRFEGEGFRRFARINSVSISRGMDNIFDDKGHSLTDQEITHLMEYLRLGIGIPSPEKMPAPLMTLDMLEQIFHADHDIDLTDWYLYFHMQHQRCEAIEPKTFYQNTMDRLENPATKMEEVQRGLHLLYHGTKEEKVKWIKQYVPGTVKYHPIHELYRRMVVNDVDVLVAILPYHFKVKPLPYLASIVRDAIHALRPDKDKIPSAVQVLRLYRGHEMLVAIGVLLCNLYRDGKDDVTPQPLDIFKCMEGVQSCASEHLLDLYLCLLAHKAPNLNGKEVMSNLFTPLFDQGMPDAILDGLSTLVDALCALPEASYQQQFAVLSRSPYFLAKMVAMMPEILDKTLKNERVPDVPEVTRWLDPAVLRHKKALPENIAKLLGSFLKKEDLISTLSVDRLYFLQELPEVVAHICEYAKNIESLSLEKKRLLLNVLLRQKEHFPQRECMLDLLSDKGVQEHLAEPVCEGASAHDCVVSIVQCKYPDKDVIEQILKHPVYSSFSEKVVNALPDILQFVIFLSQSTSVFKAYRGEALSCFLDQHYSTIDPSDRAYRFVVRLLRYYSEEHEMPEACASMLSRMKVAAIMSAMTRCWIGNPAPEHDDVFAWCADIVFDQTEGYPRCLIDVSKVREKLPKTYACMKAMCTDMEQEGLKVLENMQDESAVEAWMHRADIESEFCREVLHTMFAVDATMIARFMCTRVKGLRDYTRGLSRLFDNPQNLYTDMNMEGMAALLLLHVSGRLPAQYRVDDSVWCDIIALPAVQAIFREHYFDLFVGDLMDFDRRHSALPAAVDPLMAAMLDCPDDIAGQAMHGLVGLLHALLEQDDPCLYQKCVNMPAIKRRLHEDGGRVFRPILKRQGKWIDKLVMLLGCENVIKMLIDKPEVFEDLWNKCISRKEFDECMTPELKYILRHFEQVAHAYLMPKFVRIKDNCAAVGLKDIHFVLIASFLHPTLFRGVSTSIWLEKHPGLAERLCKPLLSGAIEAEAIALAVARDYKSLGIMLTYPDVRAYVFRHHVQCSSLVDTGDLDKVLDERAGEAAFRQRHAARRAFGRFNSTAYKDIFESVGFADTQIKRLQRELSRRYNDQPATFVLNEATIREVLGEKADTLTDDVEFAGAEFPLPEKYADFEKMFKAGGDVYKAIDALGLPCRDALIEGVRRLASKAYYAHPVHSAIRFLLIPNAWMSPEASYVDDCAGGKCSQYCRGDIRLILAQVIYLALEETPPHGEFETELTVDERLFYVIDALHQLVRQHNFDKSKDKYVDDLEGDKPTCAAGMAALLARAVTWHPKMVTVIDENFIDFEVKKYMIEWSKQCDVTNDIKLKYTLLYRKLVLVDVLPEYQEAWLEERKDVDLPRAECIEFVIEKIRGAYDAKDLCMYPGHLLRIMLHFYDIRGVSDKPDGLMMYFAEQLRNSPLMLADNTLAALLPKPEAATATVMFDAQREGAHTPKTEEESLLLLE